MIRYKPSVATGSDAAMAPGYRPTQYQPIAVQPTMPRFGQASPLQSQSIGTPYDYSQSAYQPPYPVPFSGISQQPQSQGPAANPGGAINVTGVAGNRFLRVGDMVLSERADPQAFAKQLGSYGAQASQGPAQSWPSMPWDSVQGPPFQQPASPQWPVGMSMGTRRSPHMTKRL